MEDFSSSSLTVDLFGYIQKKEKTTSHYIVYQLYSAFVPQAVLCIRHIHLFDVVEVMD